MEQCGNSTNTILPVPETGQDVEEDDNQGEED